MTLIMGCGIHTVTAWGEEEKTGKEGKEGRKCGKERKGKREGRRCPIKGILFSFAKFTLKCAAPAEVVHTAEQVQNA